MCPRPKKIRKISGAPATGGFLSLHGNTAQKVVLNLEEYEVVLLCDYEGKTQAEAAVQMHVSRPTVSRIYAAARRKIATAIVNSCSLEIAGGTVYVDGGWFSCPHCHLIFNQAEIEVTEHQKGRCPMCRYKGHELDEKKIDFIKYKEMKKIALPTRNGMIDDHFGHCEFYTLVTVNDENQVVLTETMPSPEGCGCKSNIASKLHEDGVSLMLAGNMGEGALRKLAASDIQVIRGCHGAVMDVIQAYLNGNLQDSGVACAHHEDAGHQCSHHHEGEHQCGHHHD